jgi:hypothetical protein
VSVFYYVGRERFELSKAEPADLCRRGGTPPAGGGSLPSFILQDTMIDFQKQKELLFLEFFICGPYWS